MRLGLGPATRRMLGAEVTHALRQAILSGRFSPGHHITEAEIAQQMGVSHGPVREALRELESEDLLVIEPHRGAFVKSFTANDIRQVYQFRSAIETAAVTLAIQRLTEVDLEQLEALIAQMRQASVDGDLDSLIELDLEFHRVLCERSGNRHMYAAWLRLASPIRLFLTMAVPRYLSPTDTAESHPPIVDALRRGDAAAAIRHMEHGVLVLGEQIAAAFGGMSNEPGGPLAEALGAAEAVG
ncbi:MAG TPA: GntR family transcriptional regulator [Chloroflexota bacterium]|nr:GntR family transcriptional regulator [Chloroflexota bacterium]